MLRTHSRHNGRKIVNVAEAIVESHLVLPTPGRRGLVCDRIDDRVSGVNPRRGCSAKLSV